MYFERSAFTSGTAAAEYNIRGWQAVDATPQELSFGGNPALAGDDGGVFQMGPASVAMVKANENGHECIMLVNGCDRGDCHGR